MKKKIVLFICALLALLMLLPFAALADDPSLYIKVTVVGGSNGTVALSVNGTSQSFVSGTKFAINSTDSYEITVTPNTGYIPVYTKNSSPINPQLTSTVGRDTPLDFTVTFTEKSIPIEVVGDGNGLTSYGSFLYTVGFTLPGSDYTDKSGYTLTGWEAYSENPVTTPTAQYTSFDVSAAFPGNSTTYANGVWLKPVWEGKPYTVYRIYQDSDGNILDHDEFSYTCGQTIPHGFDEASAPLKSFPGYDFTSGDTNVICKAITGSVNYAAALANRQNNNFVYRTYTVQTYDLNYELDGGDVSGEPASHTYNVDTVIPNPTKTGYTFTGWTVTNTAGDDLITTPTKNLTLNKNTEAFDSAGTLTLTANWEVNTYNITYTLGCDDGDIENFSSLPTSFQYDTLINIPNPVRTGWIFNGWIVGENPATKDYSIAANSRDSAITLVADWTANSYSITYVLNDDGETTNKGDLPETFEYVSGATVKNPTRVGWTFTGWLLGGTDQGKDFVIPANDPNFATNITLTATWEINKYVVHIQPIDHATVVLKNADTQAVIQDGEEVPYLTKIAISVIADEGYKLTKWGTETLASVESYTGTYNVGDLALGSVIEFSGVAPKEQKKPSATPVFKDETLSLDESGTYEIYCGGEKVAETADGSLASLPDSVWGKEIQIVRKGNGADSSDSDPVTVTLPERTQAPDKDLFSSSSNMRNIKITTDDTTTVYQYAISTDSGATAKDLQWQSDPNFGGLEAGTSYFIFIRVAATDSAPAGFCNVFQMSTPEPVQVDEKIEILSFILLGVIAFQIAGLAFLKKRKQQNGDETEKLSGMALFALAVRNWTLPFPQLWVLLGLLSVAVVLQIILVVKILKK